MSTKKLLSNSIIYIALGFLTPAINFILLPVYTKYLDAEDYALIAQSAVVQAIFANIIGLGVNSAFTRYFYDYYKDPQALNRLYSTAIVSYLLTGTIFLGIFSLIGTWVFDVSFKNDVFNYWEYGVYSIIIAWIANIQTLTLGYYRNKEKAINYAVWSVVFFLSVALSIYIGVVLLDYKAKGSIIGRFIGSAVPILAYVAYYFYKNRIEYSNLLNKKMILFGLPMIPYLFLNAILAQADKFAVERFFDLKILGLYSFGFLISSVNDIFINSLSSAVNPQIYKNLKNEDPKDDPAIRKLFKGYVSVGILVNIGITIAGTLGIVLFIDEKYSSVAYFFPLLSVAYLFRLFYTAYIIPIVYKKQTRVLPFINVITFVFTVLFLLGAIPLAGLIGVCIARILIQFVQMFTTIVILKRRKMFNSRHLDFKFEYLMTTVVFAYIIIWYALISPQPSITEYMTLIPLLIGGTIVIGLHVKNLFLGKKTV